MKTIFGIEIHPTYPTYYEVILEHRPTWQRVKEIIVKEFKTHLAGIDEDKLEQTANCYVLVLDSISTDNCTRVPCLPIAILMNESFERFPILVFYYQNRLTFGVQCQSSLDWDKDFEKSATYRNVQYSCQDWKTF